MSPHTVSLSLLRFALDVYWCPLLEAYVFEDRVTARGDGLFLYSARLPRNFAYPFITEDVRELYDHVNCRAALKFSSAASMEHSDPIEWLTSQGYGPADGELRSIRGHTPTTLFTTRRPDTNPALLFEEGDEQLAIVMSTAIQMYAE